MQGRTKDVPEQYDIYCDRTLPLLQAESLHSKLHYESFYNITDKKVIVFFLRINGLVYFYFDLCIRL